MAPLSTSGNIQPVRAAHRFDESALLRFLQSNVAHFPQHPETRLTVGQFGHGQSNPTFLLDVRSTAGEGGRFVLRKKPPGKLLKSAHAVDREYQVLKALNGTAVPVPKVMCLCTDASVIGTDFYVMEHVEGRIFLDPGLPEVPPPVRRTMYEEMAKTLAAIHAVDVDQVGLSRFGRRDNYCKRQVERWAAQYAASVKFPDAKPDPKMLALIDWLQAHVPEEDAGVGGPIKGLVHGDYRLDNLVFHPTEPRIIAVLDWELSTLGNQRSDLAYACLPYLFPTTYRQLYAIPKPLPEGIPQQSEYVQLYSTALGLPAPSPEQFVFYTAVSLFRAAAIFAGVYRRALQGNASSEHASKAGVLVEALADMAHDVIGRSPGRSEGRGVGNTELSHAQQKYAPGGLPGVPTGHFGKETEGAGKESHAVQKYAPESSAQKSGSATGSSDLSHAQQKYAPGSLPGVPSRHFGVEVEGGGDASHASQKYAPGSAKRSSVPEKGSAKDSGNLSHAQQKYAPGGLPGVPTGHFGKEAEEAGEASHASQKYAPGAAKRFLVPENGSEKHAGDLSHAQQKYGPGSVPGVPTGRIDGEEGNRDESHATQRYAPTTIQGVPTSSRGGQADSCCCEGGCAKASLGFEPSAKAMALKRKLEAFLSEHIYPAEPVLDAHSKSDVRWTIHPLQEQLKRTARAQGLWNLWMPKEMGESVARTLGLPRDSPLCGAGLTNLEYALCCEVMGKSAWAPEVFNCSAPDTGNMEVLARYGTPAQQKQWLLPLLDGRIRSCFAMTEPDVASSDATNIEARIAKQPGGASYVLNGKKWWTSGAMDPRCRLAIFMGKTDPSLSKHRQQSMVLVDMGLEGVRVVRPLTVFGFEDAPHGHAEVHFENVRVPAENLLLGEGRGFEIAQGRLGPGRLHHCMRLIGAAERGIELMVSRSRARTTFGKTLSEHGGLKAEIAQCRIEIEQARLLVLNAAHQLDLHGNKEARVAIAIAKVVAPNAALKVLDRAIQVHGGGGVCSDFPLSHLWVAARTLRIADGPDEVHLETIGRAELGRSRL